MPEMHALHPMASRSDTNHHRTETGSPWQRVGIPQPPPASRFAQNVHFQNKGPLTGASRLVRSDGRARARLEMQAVAVESHEQPSAWGVKRARHAPVVPYHSDYARIGGSVVAGLILARAVQLQHEADARGKDTWKHPAARWYSELNISRAQLENAIRKVEAAGFISSVVRGSPPTKHYTADLEAIRSALAMRP